MSLDLNHIARALNGEVAGDSVRAPGPGHSLKDRSLSVKPSRNGDVVVHSFAGDDPIQCKDYVREKCGLPKFEANGKSHRSSNWDVEGFMRAAIAGQRQPTPQGQHVATFDYQDAGGELLYQVLKYDNPKSFKQRQPDGKGGWIWKLDDRRVLYRLGDLLAYPDATVFITEGEKDADRLAGMDYVATTVASGKWTDECIQALAGRDIIILQDTRPARSALTRPLWPYMARPNCGVPRHTTESRARACEVGKQSGSQWQRLSRG